MTGIKMPDASSNDKTIQPGIMVQQLMKSLFTASLLMTLTLFATAVDSKVQQSGGPATLYYDLGGDMGWVPYRTGAEPGQKGIIAELAGELSFHTNIEFSAVHLPMKRAEKALRDGIIDFDFVCIEWFENNDYGDEYVISEPLFEVNEYVITRKGDSHLFPTLEALHNKRVGTIAGYFYFDDKHFTRVDFLNEDRLVSGLKLERFDAIILEIETARYWANVHELDIETAVLHSSGKLRLRLLKRNQSLLPAINTAIQKIKASGELRTMLERYGVETTIY